MFRVQEQEGFSIIAGSLLSSRIYSAFFSIITLNSRSIMWAIRKASIRIKFQPFSSLIFRGSYAKSETSRSSYTYNTGFSELPPHISHRSLTLKRFYSQNTFIGKQSFSSQAGTKRSGEEDDEVEHHESEGELISSGLFNAVINSSSISVKESLDKWVEEGNDLSRKEISIAMSELRKRRVYRKAFQLSVWLEAQEKVEFGEIDYASRVDLVAKEWGLQKAENYIEKKIPESFRGNSVYEALLANCVLNTNTIKAEQVLNKIKNLRLPITTFACQQMLLLYKRTDRKKMIDVLLLMEKENIKPSRLTYRLLIDVKGQSGDLDGMEEIVENMKGEGLEPDLRFQFLLAKHYVNLGVIEKAKAVLKEMEGDNVNENRGVASSLLHIYGLLGSLEDVKRVWEVCETDPELIECLGAIDAFGKLKKVEEAEVVFDKMSKKWKQLSAKHYTSMLKVYANNNMFSEGKNIVKRINESGCGIGPESLDALVKFYVEADEIEEAGSVLVTRSPRNKGRPLFGTYLMMLEEYGKRGDVDNAELIFKRMKEDGYVLRHGQYNSLLQAYVKAKIPAYGFRKRLEADGIIPNMSMQARLARVDAFKETAVSYLID